MTAFQPRESDVGFYVVGNDIDLMIDFWRSDIDWAAPQFSTPRDFSAVPDPRPAPRNDLPFQVHVLAYRPR